MEEPSKHILQNVNPSLGWRIWFCYGIGHVLNDICASLWFTYLLVYFHLVLNFDPVSSGIILLIGQVADAVSTFFVGIESDKNNGNWCMKYGKRKIWHLIGTLCILCTFPFIFSPCIGCKDAHVYAQMIYYAAFVTIFQFGWAAVQISHLALIPELTSNNHQRTQLTSVRYSFTVASTIFIYIVTWVSLKSGFNIDQSQKLGPSDAFHFQIVVYVGLIIGLLTSIIFHWGVREDSAASHLEKQRRKPKTITQFLKELRFYKVAIVYMCSRLFANIAQIYIPLYLQDTSLTQPENVAIIPLLMYLGSIAASGVVSQLNRILGRKVAYGLGSCLGISACVWIKFGKYGEYEIYPTALLLGASGSFLIVTSLGLTADLIDSDTESGAFVYGAMSFTDKLSNGIVVMIIQYMKCLACTNFYQNIIVFMCGGAAIMGVLVVITLRCKIQNSVNDETKPLLRDVST